MSNLLLKQPTGTYIVTDMLRTGLSHLGASNKMAKITYVTYDDQRFEVDAANGSTVMENAIKNSVPGIEAECGGACACATCHVYISDEWQEAVGGPEVFEGFHSPLPFSADMILLHIVSQKRAYLSRFQA